MGGGENSNKSNSLELQGRRLRFHVTDASLPLTVSCHQINSRGSPCTCRGTHLGTEVCLGRLVTGWISQIDKLPPPSRLPSTEHLPGTCTLQPEVALELPAITKRTQLLLVSRSVFNISTRSICPGCQLHSCMRLTTNLISIARKSPLGNQRQHV